MTDMHARERIAPTQPMRSGLVERREFAYARHGTLRRIGNVEGANGQILVPARGPTRTKADGAAQIAQPRETDPDRLGLFVVDQLNTPQSETLVRLVAEPSGITEDVGEKGKAGVLQAMAPRAAFLRDPTQRM